MSSTNQTNIKSKEILFTDLMARLYPTKSADLKTKTITFQVTEDCSLACKYCYQTNKSKKKMTWDVAKLMIDKLLSGEDGFDKYLVSPTAIILEFIGGEPFLEIDLMDKITDYFRLKAIEMNHPWAEKFIISICTNGVAYKDKKVQKYLQKNRDHLAFSITIDGTKELHDSCRVFPDGSPSYDIAHAAAEDWMRRGNYLGSKVTLAPENVDYFCDSLKQMIFDGYTTIHANAVYEEGWTIEDAKRVWIQSKNFADWIRNSEYRQENYYISFFDETYGTPMGELELKNWCGGTGEMLAVDPDGNLFPCLRFMKSSLGCSVKPLIIGNVWDGIAQKDDEKEIIKCLDCVNRRTQSTDECFYCPVASGCSWCSAYNYQMTGSVDKRVTFICEIHKARSIALTYYWNNYYYKNNINNVHDLWVPKQWAIPIIGEEEYEKLKSLTLKLGGYVNESETMIKQNKKQ